MRLYLYLTIGIVFSHGYSVNADYVCVCNNGGDPVSVINAPDERRILIGNINVGSCVAQKTSTDQNWISVIFKHQVGYILNTTDLKVTICAYDPRPEDRLTTAVSIKTETDVSQMSTSDVTVSTFVPSTNRFLKTLVIDTEQTTVPTTSGPKTTMSQTIDAHTTMPQTTEAQTTIVETTLLDTTIQNPATTQTTKMPTTATTKVIMTTKQATTPNPGILKGHVELCPNRIQQLAHSRGEFLAQFGQNCYEVVDSGVSWSHAEEICKGHGGHLIHIANQQEQDFIFDFLVKHHMHTVWLGLNDRNTEEKFEWTSGDSLAYENWKLGRKDYRHHNAEDCVFMTPTTGEWDDVECGGNNALSELIQGIRHSFICQYAVTTSHIIDGNINICPYRLQQLAKRDNGILAQHDHSCYELVPNSKVSWQHAEEICTYRGGHLVYISSAQEQTFVQNFMKYHYPDHAVWIGLTDRNTEGRFHWASGAYAQYTNWLPGHKANYASSSQEDCVVLIPYKNGQWDDIPCGHTHHSLFGGTSSNGETHPLLCEYSTSTGTAIIG